MKNTGLTVKPSTEQDRKDIEALFDREGYYYQWDEEFREFELPEENTDALEMELSRAFNRNGISANFSTY